VIIAEVTKMYFSTKRKYLFLDIFNTDNCKLNATNVKWIYTSNPKGQSIRQLWAGQLWGLSQSTTLLLGALVPGISAPISSTHQQLRPCGSHCILSNSPVSLLHCGMNCWGPRTPRARDLLTAANSNCSHPVNSPETQRRPHAVLQQRSSVPWHW